METDELIKVMKRTLKVKGFFVDEEDTEVADALEDALERASQYIRNFCNLQEVPDQLCYPLTDMACGYFLRDMYDTGKLDEAYGIEAGAVSSLKLGDTQVNYTEDGSGANARVLAIISGLTDGKEGELLRFRKLTW